MAFDENNLLAPIWQRTANNVLSSSSIDESKTIDNSNEIKDEKSITLSKQSPYIWNRSIQSLNNDSQTLSNEYNGRMISQSTISNDDQLKSKYFFFLFKFT
jgi:hypothetical protein